MKYSRLIVLCLIMVGFLVSWMQNLAQETDSEITADTPVVDDCAELRFLMKNNQTPFDYAIGGGVLDFSDSVASITQDGALMSDAWADYWVFRVGKLDDTGQAPEGEEITEETSARLSLDFADSELTLEVGLFLGNDVQRQNAQRFVTLTADNRMVAYNLTQSGVYTLVVRRPYLSDTSNVGRYNFSAQLNRGNTILGDINTVLGQYDVRLVGGRQVVNFNTGAQASVTANSIKPISENGIADTISTRKLNLVGGGSITLEEATQLHYSGGSFGANWEGTEGPLTAYIHRFDIGEETNKTINQAISLIGSAFSTNEQWSGVRGVWILEGCWGFKQRAINNDGITFVAPIDLRNERKISLFNYNGNPDCRTGIYIGVNADENNPNLQNPTKLCIELQGIEAASEITLTDGVFRAQLLDERVIEIQSANIQTFARENGNPSVGEYYPSYGKNYYLQEETLTQDQRDRLPSYQPNNESLPLINAPLTVSFENETKESVNLVIDWINVQTFSYKDPSLYDAQEQASKGECAGQSRCIRVQFGKDDTIRTFTFRKGDNLQTLETLDDVTQIVYADGEEYLLLPSTEGFVELVTPADDAPTFNGAEFDVNARPNTAGYAPRQANNLGGECDAFPTVLPELNCAPNGHVNPANGNLWYSVTDHRAEGYLFDLALTRSYNSLDASLDSPFGFGWSSDFQLDYILEMDTALNARRVTAENVNNYRVGLNLVFAPRGMIVYNAPTGSRQVFVRTDEENGNLDFYRSLTMPGWVLFRPNIRSGWQMYQDNDLTIYFDRAGRMTSYGFFEQNRAISISYYMDLKGYVNGPKNYGESNYVMITDDFRLRQLALYYNTDGHIYRSIMRDTQRLRISCRLADNCYETLYKYRNGQLIEVVYPNRQVATYKYDAQNRLLSHDDPLAPVAQHMTYTYSDAGVNEIRIINSANQDATLWQKWTYNDNQAVLTDEHGVAQTVAFDVNDGAWDSQNASFTLLRTEKAGFITDYDWNRLTGRELLEFVISRYGDQTRRQTQYQYSDRRGILGGVVLSGIVKDGPNKVYEIPVEIIRQDSANNRYVFTSFSTSDPYGFTPAQLYGQINDFNFGNGRAVSVAHSGSSTTLFPREVVERNGKNWSLARYSDSRRSNWLQQAFLLNSVDGATTIELIQVYDYNGVGLVTQFLQARPQDGADSYFVRYQYDGLGRIRRIIDSELGTYIIEQKDLICAKEPVCREVTVTDPMNAVTIYRFDGRNHLLEVRLQEDKRGELLRKTTYEYDHRDRLIAQIEYLDDITCSEFGALATPTPEGNTTSPDCLITTYQYASTGASERITRTNPMGQVTIVEYDALGRVVQTTAENGLVTDYAYTPQNSSLVVTQTEQYSQPIITTYKLDLQQRLTNIDYNAPNQDTPNADDADGIFNLLWNFSYANALNSLTAVQANNGFLQANFAPNSLRLTGNPTADFNQQPITYNTADDLLGNLAWLQTPTQTDDGTASGNSTQATYCTEPKGAQKVIYFRQSGEAPQPAKCDEVTAGVDAVYWYDVSGRLSKIADEFGTRTFAYDKYTLADYRWSVTMSAASLDESLTYTWVMVYNLAGDLVQWTDDSGVTRFYDYDKVGRLLRVSTGDENDDATMLYMYNALGQVIRQEDGRGRGMIYEYDVRGNLIAKTDIVSGVSTVYTLNADNLVTQVQQADDIIATYAYEHPTHPLLLTRYTDRATRTHQFAWAFPTDLRNNSLTYTDPNGNTTRYAFNGLGQLRVAIDAMGNKYEWEYDDAGYFSRFTPPSSVKASDDTPIRYAYQLETIPTFDADNELLVAVVDFVGNEPNRYQWRRTNTRTPSGQLAQFASPGVLANTYDPLGRLTQMRLFDQSNNLLYAWQIQRQQARQIIQLNTPSDSLFGLTSDPLNRLRNVDSPNNSANYRYITPFTQSGETPSRLLVTENGAVSEYIEKGNQVEYRAEGKTQVYTHDTWGRLVNVATTTCTPLGENQRGCEGASDSTSNQLSYEYDLADNLISVDYGEGFVERFVYDANDNMTQYTLEQKTEQGAWQTTYTYHYDTANRLIAIDMPDGYRTYLFVVGELTTKMCRLPISETLLTVVADREKACNDAQAFIDRYDHNVLGNLIAKAYPSYIKPTNDNLTGNFEVPPGNSGSDILRNGYTPLGLLQSFGASAQYSYSQDALNLLERYDSGQNGDSYDFGYEPSPLLNDAQIMRLTAVQSTQDWADMVITYDVQGRVASATLGAQTFNYTYERNSYTIAHAENTNLAVTRPNDWQVPSALQVGIDGASYDEATRQYTLTRTAGTAQVVTVYDINLQPIRTKVTNNGELVYESAFTPPTRPLENEAIFIITETRTFADGTTVTVKNEFIAPASNRDVQWNPMLPLASQTVTLPLDKVGTALDLYAKDSSPVDLTTHRYFYEYDAQGNLTQVVYYGPFNFMYENPDATTTLKRILNPVICASYEYDGANRLVKATLTGEEINREAIYGYDAYNRLVSVNGQQIVYLNDDAVPSFVFEGDNNGSAITDLQPLSGGVLDGFGRYIPFDGQAPVTSETDVCHLGMLKGSMKQNGVLFDELLVDPTTQLAFYGGRAYLPSIGRFMQRNPQGTDLNGNLYQYVLRSPVVPMPTQRQDIGTGLRVLQEATALMSYEIPTAQSILQANQPTVNSDDNSLFSQLQQDYERVDQTIQDLLTFPNWLAQSYNQPSVQYDIRTGELAWDSRQIIGQHGSAWTNNTRFDDPFWGREWGFTGGITQPENTLAQMLMPLQPDFYAPTTNPFNAWQAQTPRLNDILQRPQVNIGDAYTLKSILPRLLAPWLSPQDNVAILDLTQAIREQVTMGGTAWTAYQLDANLPNLPTVPLPQANNWYLPIDLPNRQRTRG
jgi:RHS repeat-associated protein